ncbi:metallophosphoesterase [Spirosoma sp. BT702]|uniref:Metallophosphoesterase n=1 Tax=Spirosoma profusum TaxID=2771354 RepID=A0A927AT04_9BACT|nr:metallophosphoesterase [Spirosoma profusum]MBD2702210.1 metallophosphoesterase [Spirosoma profusum]
MRIAFITDMHLDAEGEKPAGVDVRQNFLDALAYLAELKPNCLVIGGDICNTEGDEAIYRWVKSELDKLPMPYFVIPGNHDDSAMMAEIFKLTHNLIQSELYYALPMEGRPALFLDSGKGAFSEEQWNWLEDYIKALRDTNVVIFMHHPPLRADVEFMDSKYPFRQSERFLELVRELPCHVTVICGHYHVEKVVQRGNLVVLLSPSTFYQMKQDTPEFAVDNYRIGLREIDLTLHGTISNIYYLEPSVQRNTDT